MNGWSFLLILFILFYHNEEVTSVKNSDQFLHDEDLLIYETKELTPQKRDKLEIEIGSGSLEIPTSSNYWSLSNLVVLYPDSTTLTQSEANRGFYNFEQTILNLFKNITHTREVRGSWSSKSHVKQVEHTYNIYLTWHDDEKHQKTLKNLHDYVDLFEETEKSFINSTVPLGYSLSIDPLNVHIISMWYF